MNDIFAFISNKFLAYYLKFIINYLS